MNTITRWPSDFSEQENKTREQAKGEERKEITSDSREAVEKKRKEVLTVYSDGCRGNAGRLHKRTVFAFFIL